MNFQFYLEKLYDSKNFKEFIKENKNAYPCSGFFVIDLEKNQNQQHFDYFVPSINKIFSFKIENNCEKVLIENQENYKTQKLSMNYTFDLGEIKNMIAEKMQEEKINSRIQKILLSLQRAGKKELLVGTVFISNLGMIKITIDVVENKIIEFQKKSFLDMFKIIKKD
jgi:hypothetical protein